MITSNGMMKKKCKHSISYIFIFHSITLIMPSGRVENST